MSYPFQFQLTNGEAFSLPGLAPQHLQEWLDSGVDPELIALNVKSLNGEEAFDYLLFNLPPDARRNDGRLGYRSMFRYRHLEAGGWWVGGLDPLNDWKPMDWGRFKPDEAFHDPKKDKPIKYESPPNTPND